MSICLVYMSTSTTNLVFTITSLSLRTNSPAPLMSTLGLLITIHCSYIDTKVLQVNLSLSLKRIPNTMFPVCALVIVVFLNASSHYDTETKIQILSTDTRQSAYLQIQIHFLYSPFLLTLSSCIPTQYEVASNYLMYHISF